MSVNLWETIYVIAYATEVIQIFFDFIESEISGQKCIFNAWIEVSRLIPWMSCHALTLMGCSFCYLHVTEKMVF